MKAAKKKKKYAKGEYCRTRKQIPVSMTVFSVLKTERDRIFKEIGLLKPISLIVSELVVSTFQRGRAQ